MFILFLLTSRLSVAAEPAPMFQRAANYLEDRYLWIEELNIKEACISAAEESESSIPWIIVTPTETGVQIQDYRSDRVVEVELPVVDESAGLAPLVDCLGELDSVITNLASPLPDDTDLRVELTQGVMRTLDRHTVVMAKSRLARFDERIKGKLTGIGAELRLEDGVLWAERVFEGSPAQRGGLQKEDAIHRVDGVSTIGMSMRQAIDRIRGPKGSDVVLSVVRRISDGTDQQLDLVFTRAEVHIPNVEWELTDKGVGIIRIDHFSDQTARLTAQALEFFEEQAKLGQPYNGILLDLRSNSGGSLIQSAETVDLFVSDGEIVRTEGRNGATVPNLVKSIKAHPPANEPHYSRLPLVVMQNQKSASASEIVAGALAGLGRAVIVGRRSYGKGTVQKLYTLRGGKDRVRVKMTVAEYRLQDGQVVHEAGIIPDLAMRRIVFNGSGAWIPPQWDGDVPYIIEVDERVGWRPQGEFDKNADPLETFGRQLVLESRGPSRTDGLEAIERLATVVKQSAEEKIADVFLLRNLDWRATDDQPGILDAAVNLELVGTARAGERVQLNAEVRNDGPAPLYQARIRLKTDTRSPWRSATIPIGFIPPGETARGTVEIAIPASSPSRSDDVLLILEADALDPVELEPVPLDIEGHDVPPMAAKVRLSPHGDHHRIEVVLENRGEINLTGMRLKLGWREDSGVEIINQEAILPVLAAGKEGRFDLEVRVLEGVSDEGIPLEVRVGADRFPLLTQFPVTVPLDGELVTLVRPTVHVDTPVRTDASSLSIPVQVKDDGLVESMTLWWNGEKHAWMPGAGTGQLEGSVDVPVQAGPNTLTIITADDDALETRVTHKIWGVAEPETTSAE